MIAFVGPFPQPVHGFSWVNRQVFNGLLSRSVVSVYDRARPRLSSGVLQKFLRPWITIGQWFIFVFRLLFSRPLAIYIGWSGGAGMILDFPFALAARVFRLPVYVHHHSFAYLNSPSFLARSCLALMRKCQHVVLCERMGALLSTVHLIPAENVTVLSNAAFLPATDQTINECTGTLTVGFLSNITAEKGIFDFFDLAERFAGIDDGPLFLIAGPIGDSVREVFHQRSSELRNVQHVGPVYGEAKDAFYRRLDLLAFPTRYPNEAEPVTILEAFRAGVPVIANHRGCIATMLDEFSGLGVLRASDFVDEAAALLERLAASPDELVRLKQGAWTRFSDLQEEHARKLDWLLGRIAAGLPLKGQ